MLTIANRYPGDFEHWSNQSLLLQSLGQMAKKINELLDKSKRMQSNQDLLKDANIRQQMELMQNSMQLMNNSFHDLVGEVQLVQQEMISIKQNKCVYSKKVQTKKSPVVHVRQPIG
jgi:hypothetical protein